jgi:hypothetical protein
VPNTPGRQMRAEFDGRCRCSRNILVEEEDGGGGGWYVSGTDDQFFNRRLIVIGGVPWSRRDKGGLLSDIVGLHKPGGDGWCQWSPVEGGGGK